MTEERDHANGKGESSGRDSTQRFSDRVENYVKYRPGYPDALFDILRRETGAGPGWKVADVGSGTGISADLFLRNGLTVVGIEPNEAMRLAAEEWLRDDPSFHSAGGTAEETGLPDASVELVAAGQAFHWFDRAAARREFARILKPRGWVALFWNGRRTGSTPFLRAYEELLLRFATDYTTINHMNIDDAEVARFFAPDEMQKFSIENAQIVDFDGLRGRLLSSSYVPTEGDPRYEPMLDELRRIYDRYAEDDAVRIEYDLVLYLGRLGR